MRLEKAMSDDARPEVEQTHDPVQGLPRRPFAHCPAPERSMVYVDPVLKTPEALAEVVGELEEVARLLCDFPPSKGKDDELRTMVIKAAITVKGCAEAWGIERRQKATVPAAPMCKLLFFGPSDPGSELAKDMEKAGVLPETWLEVVLSQLVREGWRVVLRHYDPSFVMRQWRVMLERP